MGLEHRARFEELANDFRATHAGDSRALSLRTLVSGELEFRSATVGVELEDARAYASSETPLHGGIVNPLEILRAYAELRAEDLWVPGDHARVALGRVTLDVGSRRLLARNEFRNTVNAFTGVDAEWISLGGHRVRVFGVVPVPRLPADAAALSENRLELDRENPGVLFFGTFFGSAPLEQAVSVETYAFGLSERDTSDAPSQDRKLLTYGVRALRPRREGQVDFQFEWMLQLGTSRASAASEDTTDLTHRAASGHVSVGYAFQLPSSPRVAFQYDLATGDADPADRRNGRFDPLFGARRFDFGPTGLYGVALRSNVSSPGLRIELAPHERFDAVAGARLMWLASRRDAWTAAGLRDPSGAAGAFVGYPLEARFRWRALPENLVFEAGAAWLVRGGFATATAPNREAPVYVYTQLTATL